MSVAADTSCDPEREAPEEHDGSARPSKRVKGRPMRGRAEVGRDKLIEAACSVFRLHALPYVSRKAVAAVAGVSPALVTYYFPDRYSLVTAATQPVIGRLVGDILATLDQQTPHVDRLRGIARLFIALSDAERSSVDVMGAFNQDPAGAAGRSVLAVGAQRLIAFHAEGVAAGSWRAVDGRVFVAAMWGICRAVAERGPDASDAAPFSRSVRDAQVETVVDFALNGMGTRGLV